LLSSIFEKKKQHLLSHLMFWSAFQCIWMFMYLPFIGFWGGTWSL